MKLGDLLEICKYSPIRLHSGFNGRLIAESRKSLEKYKDVTVLSIYPKMKCNSDGDFVRPYLYVFGDHNEIEKIWRCE